MESRSLTFIAQQCGGTLKQGSPDLPVARIATDSRRVQSGDLFAAIVGARFDGHDFLREAARRGAVALLAARSRLAASLPECAVIEVEDTRQALGQLAAAYRAQFNLPVVAVAGSNGKTTTKELLVGVLSQRFSTLGSPASFNNDIGVPLTLLELARSHRVAVLEAGTNHPGELAPLLQMIRPRYGVLTSLGREHLEFFGDLSGVAREEGWLAELLPLHGKLWVNGDCPEADSMIKRSRAPVVRLGLNPGNDWRASRVQVNEGGTSFWVEGPDPAFVGDYRVKLLGRHQAVNALFAVAIGAELGLKRLEIERGLAACPPATMRLQIWHAGGLRVLDDAYNANADSMLAALQTARDLPCAGRRVAVLGDMAELGRQSRAAHEEVGRRAVELGITSLFAVGQWAPVVGAAARLAGLAEVREFATVEAASPKLKAYVKPGDLILLKASRSTRLERLAEALRAEPQAKERKKGTENTKCKLRE